MADRKTRRWRCVGLLVSWFAQGGVLFFQVTGGFSEQGGELMNSLEFGGCDGVAGAVFATQDEDHGAIGAVFVHNADGQGIVRTVTVGEAHWSLCFFFLRRSQMTMAQQASVVRMQPIDQPQANPLNQMAQFICVLAAKSEWPRKLSPR